MNQKGLVDEFGFLSQVLQEIFSFSFLEETARETGFIQREGKLKAADFIALCVFLNDQSGQKSLGQLCGSLGAHRNINLSTEGLNQRFNESAVTFMKKVFTTALKQKFLDTSELPDIIMQLFKRIRILDSSGFGLPHTCAEQFRGSTGPGLKVQLEYELISGQFMEVVVQDGVASDQKFGSSLIETINSGDLCLRDLGYFSYKDLQETDKRGAYYISRLKPNSAVYIKEDPLEDNSKYIKLDFEEIMEKMSWGETLDLPDVYIGYEYKVPTRLIICKLTEEQTEQRLIIREKKEKKKGVKYTPQTKKLSALNMFVTNLPSFEVSKQDVYKLYSLRWQIEIIFKSWKSIFEIDRVKKMKVERVECHLYGTLLSLLISSSIVFQVRLVLYQKKNKEASEYKSMAIVKEYYQRIQTAIFNQKVVTISKLIRSIYQMIEKNGKKSKRYNKMTVFDILEVTYKEFLKNKA